MSPLYWLLGIGAFAAVCNRVLQWRRHLAAIAHHPGQRTLFSHFTRFPLWIPGVFQGTNLLPFLKFAPFAQAGCDVITRLHALPVCGHDWLVGSPLAFKEISSSRPRFPKAVKIYDLLSLYGPNIFTVEGDEWKKHRKPTAPAFSERNNRLVWDESIKIVSALFESNAWKGKTNVPLAHAVDLTLPLTLFVIGVAGFGKPVSWDEKEIIPPGHKLAFKEALHIASLGVIPKAILPAWVLKLVPKFRNITLGFDELEAYIREMISERRGSDFSQRWDLLSGLLSANEDPEDPGLLENQEIVSDIWLYLLAGHETTAHSLAFLFAVLALYPQVQEEVYEQIMSVLAGSKVARYEDMDRFTKVMSVFYETIRFYTPVPIIVKDCPNDAVLQTLTSEDGVSWKPKNILIQAGDTISINFAAMHAHPHYWKDPEEFRPWRFLEPDWPREAFHPFSNGARSCIGRKFAETETTAVMVTLLSEYRIELPENDPVLSKLSTLEEKRDALTKADSILTLTPRRIPLVFRRR